MNDLDFEAAKEKTLDDRVPYLELEIVYSTLFLYSFESIIFKFKVYEIH